MSKPRRKAKPAMPHTPVADRPVVPPPDWFAEPVGLPIERAKRDLRIYENKLRNNRGITFPQENRYLRDE